MDNNEYINNHEFYKVDSRGQIIVTNKDVTKDELNVNLFKELFNFNNVKKKIDEIGLFSLKTNSILIRDKNTYYRTKNSYIDITDMCNNNYFELYFVFSLLDKNENGCKNIGPFKSSISSQVFSYTAKIQIKNRDNLEHELISNIIDLFSSKKETNLIIYTVDSVEDDIDFMTSREFKKDLILEEYTLDEIYKVLEKLESEKEIKQYLVKENFK
ncbi:hypothetical protein CPT_Machias_124 [Staphylococcus phage Machias]|nr:hypothetical protein CPT_Machias_124 [Staphylococcus phage Machias]